MSYPYSIGQRFIAAMLVSSLLLQSCYNPSIPNLPQPREVFRVKEVLSLEEIREEENGLSAKPSTLPLKYESPTITHDLPRDKLVVTQSTLQVEAVAENPSKKLVPVVDSSRQLSKPTQDANFSKPGNYEELKDNFYKSIASLNQVDKVRAEQLLKQIYSEEEINVAIKIKNFIREHSNHFQSLLILFDTSGEDWEFKDDHINTFVNMIKEQKEGVKSHGNNNVKKDVNHLPSVTGLAADPARVKLGENILLLIGAELDERLSIYHRLQEELKEILKEDGYLRGLWSHLWRDLEEPELLVNKKTYERLVQQPKSASWLKNLEEQVFANYKKVYQELETFKKELAEKYPTHPEWVSGLDKVAEFYKHFEQNLCSSLSDPVQFYSLIEPKALLMGEWWPGCYYRVTQSQAHHLLGLDEQGKAMTPPSLKEQVSHKHPAKSNQSTSNHTVSFLPAGDVSKAAVYFKVNGMPALNPSREYMLYSLYKRLGIQVPAFGLLVLDHVKFKESYEQQPFILQASEAIPGLSGKKVLKENLHLPLDYGHFEKQVIGALLTGPVDGKPDNFVITSVGEKKGWVSIDNDEVFQAPIRKEGSIHLKSILLLLPEIRQSISSATKTFLKCLHPSMLVLAWLVDLQGQTLTYAGLKKTLGLHGENTLYPRKGGKLLAKHLEELWQELSLPFTNLYHSTVLTFQSLLGKLQALVSTHKNQEYSLEDLFAHCYPYVYRCYKYLQEKAFETEQEALNSPPYKAFWLLHKGEKASLPVDESIIPEAAYFLADQPLSIEKQISKYLKEQTGLNPDQVIQAYSSWLYQTTDPLQKSFICAQALESLHVLQQYGLKEVQDVKAAIELYTKVIPVAKEIRAEKAWENVFDTFAKTNAELAWLLSLERNFPKGWEHEQKNPQHVKEIRGAHVGRRQLSAAMQKSLLDEQGKFKKDLTLSGRSSTNKYPANQPLFYFKKYPEIPGYEYAATAFMRQLGLQAAPRSELLTFYHPEEGIYPVLLTQAIAGKPVYQVWDNDQNFAHLDPYSTGLLMVASMLLNPEDSKEDNFILSEDQKQLIPIDNDHTFLPGAIEVNGILKVYPQLQTKTLAFCLQEMYKPLPTSLVEQLTSMSADFFLGQWLTNLAKVGDGYQNILPEASLKTLWEKQGSCLRLPLSKAYIQGLYLKFHLLRTILLQNPKVTPLELLKRLEPYVGKSYEEVAKLPTLKERFQAVSSIYKKKTAQGVRISVASSQRLMEIMEVPSNEIQGNLIHCKLGPLAALEELKRLTQNKEVQDARLQGLLRDPIAPLKKLTQEDEELLIQKWFESKKPYYWIQLHDSHHLQENHLDDQKFQNKGHYLTSLDLRGAKNLGEIAFTSLHTNCPNLKYLNISGWPLVRLSHLKKAPGLLWNGLEFSKSPIFPSLQRLIVQGCNPLREINVHLPALESLEAGGNTNLVSFSLIAPVLKYLDMTGHQVKEEALNLQINSAANINLKGVNLGIMGTLTEEIEKLKTARGGLGRIRKELVDLNETRSEAFSLDLVDENPYKWRVAIKGPENSYYSGGVFFLDISFPGDYPFKPPTFRFSTKIFHPNISATTGLVCISHLLNETPSVNTSYFDNHFDWSPAFTVRRLLEVIRDMLDHPSGNCAQSKEAQFLLKTNREAFGKKAREWTKEYARQAQNKEKSKSEGI